MPSGLPTLPRCSSGAVRPRSPTPVGCGTRAKNSIPGSAARRTSSMREWRWPRGGKIKFSHLQFDSTVYDWQGAQITLICFDELTHFTARQFFYMVSRNRSTCGVRPYIRATCNPDADSWVAGFLAWWIDPASGLPIPERAGVLRYFVRDAEKILWADKPEELMPDLPRREDLPPGIDPPRPISVTFIPATVFDNPALLQINPEYYTWLLSLPTLERERLLYGNWKIRPIAGLYFKREWCAVVDEVPVELDVVRCWDLAATEKTQFNDPDWTVGIKLGRDRNGGYWLLDMARARSNPETSSACCATPPSRTASGCASGSARIRARPARAKRLTWCAHLAASLRPQLRRAGTSSPGSGRSVRSAVPVILRSGVAHRTMSCSAFSKASLISRMTTRSTPAAEPWKCSTSIQSTAAYFEWMRNNKQKERRRNENPEPPKSTYAVGSMESLAREHGVA